MTRFRKSQIEERSRNINRLQKFLESANVKIGDWLSDAEGKSATQLLELIIGKPDFTVEEVASRMHGNMKSTVEEVASRMHGNMKSTPDELFRSPQGCMTPTQRGLFSHIMAIIREQTVQIEKTDAMIKRSLSDAYKTAIVALDAIPGIGVVSAEQIVAETGVDMSHFKSQHSLCEWAGICPGNNKSAGKRKSGKTPPGNKTLKSTLTQSAKSANRNKKSFFSAQYNRLVSHRGKNRATTAVAHSILIAVYFVLSGHQFKDLGADYYTQFNKEKKINSHFKQLSKLGVTIPDHVLRELLSHSSEQPSHSA